MIKGQEISSIMLIKKVTESKLAQPTHSIHFLLPLEICSNPFKKLFNTAPHPIKKSYQTIHSKETILNTTNAGTSISSTKPISRINKRFNLSSQQIVLLRIRNHKDFKRESESERERERDLLCSRHQREASSQKQN